MVCGVSDMLREERREGEGGREEREDGGGCEVQLKRRVRENMWWREVFRWQFQTEN
jgi:hypothetical protein